MNLLRWKVLPGGRAPLLPFLSSPGLWRGEKIGRRISLNDDDDIPKEHHPSDTGRETESPGEQNHFRWMLLSKNFPDDVFSLEFPCVLIVCLRGGSAKLVWKLVSDNFRIGGRLGVQKLPQSGSFTVVGKFYGNKPTWMRIFGRKGKTNFLLEQTLPVSFGRRKMWARFFLVVNTERREWEIEKITLRESRRACEGGKWNWKGKSKNRLVDECELVYNVWFRAM